MLVSAFYSHLRRTQLLFTLSIAKSLTTTSLNFYSTNLGINIYTDKEKHYCEFLKNAHQTYDYLYGKTIHTHLIKTNFMSYSIFLQNFLLSLYVKFDDFGSALQVFDEMPQRNVVSWTTFISGFVRHGLPKEGLIWFSCMFRDAVRPNEFTLSNAFGACCSYTGFIPQSYGIYAVVIKLGYECDVFVSNAFLTALIKNERYLDAVKAFDSCLEKDIVSWNAMISGCLQFSPSEFPGFWLRLISEGMKPDGFTFSIVFSGLALLGDATLGVQIHDQLVKYGHGGETCVANSLVDMYLKFGNVVDGFKAFHEMSCRNVLSWTAMATGCLSCGGSSKALELLREMRVVGLRPNQYSLATTFKACASLASLDEGRKAHGLRIKLGSEMDLCVDNALVDMYVKCGCMDNAMAVFHRMKDRTIVTWTAMVMGFAQNGQAREALRIFDELVSEGVEPNYITFVCVLFACSQGGFVEEGWKYFSSMRPQYGISPGEHHFVCMVDLLGRTGRIKEAEELISRMPFQPGPLVWQSLLGACHIHGDIEAGKHAAASALRARESYPSTYVTLSNMLADLSNWEGAEALRGLMEARNISKTPGTSSLSCISPC